MIGHPIIAPADSKTYTQSDFIGNAFWLLDEPPPKNTQLLEIPINDRSVLVALYIREHPAVEAAIRHMNWRAYPLN